jgi:GT2 family glycosyltransferase
MRKLARGAARFLLCLISPLLLLIAAFCLAAADVWFLLFGKRRVSQPVAPRTRRASVVIASWNGRDLLENFLPSVIAALEQHPGSEIIVVDNASSDGSEAVVRRRFPTVRVLPQQRNLGFAGASNAGVRAAKNEIVVLLNNDMLVEPDFLAPLLEPFADPFVFSVSCQIFFLDPAKQREETGLTETQWQRGRLRVGHRADPQIDSLFPCAYPGGGSSAFDRKKFLELGGFDELFRPFYYEDTDLGHLAWKRGWKVLYQPASVVYHEHRGTIGKKFTKEAIAAVVKKNEILYCWKNIHDWKLLASHVSAAFFVSLLAILGGEEAQSTAFGLGKAFLQLPEALQSRRRARELSVVSDREAFRRPLGGYFRDRFEIAAAPPPERLQVLFASPYPIEPPTHGGAVFMKQTLRALAPETDVHLISFVRAQNQIAAQQPAADLCASAQFFVRDFTPPRHPSTTLPHAIREFWHPEFAWAIHRTIYLRKIDLVQIEYTVLGQYAEEYNHLPCFLFEHDVFFQSLWRRMKSAEFSLVGLLEYLRMFRYELRLLRRVARVQVCSRENARYLLGFLPQLRNEIDSDLRAAIDTGHYRFVDAGRERDTILFVGNFEHSPNVDALNWFGREVFPQILERRPEANLIIVGSPLPSSFEDLIQHSNVRYAGVVPDVRAALAQCAVFVCPVLSGSGVRVKLLEAFASGIPAVSTTIGAEGLTSASGEVCELADSPGAFARAVVTLLQDETYALQLALRAREMIERERDLKTATARLLERYRSEVERRRGSRTAQPSPAFEQQRAGVS